MTTFYTPPGYTGQAELTASNGLAINDQGLWRLSQAGYNDSATFGLSLTSPSPLNGGNLILTARDWAIAVVGNELTSYTNPDTSETYSASQCRIQVTGRWEVIRQQNSNSFNSFNITYTAFTATDQGDRLMAPNLLNLFTPVATYEIQGANVAGGAKDTFSNHEFFCRSTEIAASTNSNKEFQSNTILRPVWAYTYTKSWQTAA